MTISDIEPLTHTEGQQAWPVLKDHGNYTPVTLLNEWKIGLGLEMSISFFFLMIAVVMIKFDLCSLLYLRAEDVFHVFLIFFCLCTLFLFFHLCKTAFKVMALGSAAQSLEIRMPFKSPLNKIVRCH